MNTTTANRARLMRSPMDWIPRSLSFITGTHLAILSSVLLWTGVAGTVVGQEPAAAEQPAGTESTQQDQPLKPIIAVEQLPKDFTEVLDPIFARLVDAKELRATVKISVTSSVGNETLGKNEGVFQIASRQPNLLGLSAKFDTDSVMIVSDGKQLFVQLSPDAYVQQDAPKSLTELSQAMPLQLGPQPEPLLWLTLAGIDSRLNMLTGLTEAVRLANPPDKEGVALVKGERVEGTRWILQVATGDSPRPLAMALDLTDMITKANTLQVPEGYSFRVNYVFERWEVGSGVEDSMFAYTAPKDAKKFDSIADYILRDADGDHPLLGKPTPRFTAKTLSGEDVELKDQPGEVFVLDFWATWCDPCVEALPKMAELAKELEEQGVRFYAVNVGETADVIEEFLKAKKLDIPVIVDPESRLATAFAATAIPQTVLIGKDGRVEAIHLGFDAEKSADLMRQEVESLLAGRRIFAAEEVEEPAPAAEKTDDSATPAKPKSPTKDSKDN